MVFSRRIFLGLAGAMAVARTASAEVAPDGIQVLRAGKAKLPLLGPDVSATDVLIFSAQVIRARQGEPIRLRIVNELEDDLWLHWFGVRGPSDQMTINVMPGEANAVDCSFTPPDAGTFWLGPMAHQSRLRDMGLTAMLVVEEATPIAGLADVPLILDDWKVGDDGTIDPTFGDMNLVVGEGRLGNWFTINRQFRPKLPLPVGQYGRLRLLNAANSRDMLVQFKGGDPMVLALDGQPVPPRFLGHQSLSLAPGQRADLLVDGRDGDMLLALDLFEDIAEIGTLVSQGGEPPPELADNFGLPPNPLAAAPDLASAVTVPLVIEGGENGGMTGAILNGQQRGLRELLEAGMAWAINGIAGAGGAPLATFSVGGTAIVAVENRTIFEQPLHVHGHVWQMIEQGGQALEAKPFRDTAVIPARGTAKLALVADNPGTWAIQSLVAERADAGLTVAFIVA